MLAFLLAVLWFPVTAHCQLERLGVSTEQRCCPRGGSPEVPLDQPFDAGCCALEKAPYQSSNAKAVAWVPMAVVVLVSVPEPDPGTIWAEPASPGLPNTWQFFFRAALSPRAPSLEL